MEGKRTAKIISTTKWERTLAEFGKINFWNFSLSASGNCSSWYHENVNSKVQKFTFAPTHVLRITNEPPNMPTRPPVLNAPVDEQYIDFLNIFTIFPQHFYEKSKADDIYFVFDCD